jgi:Abnormal spindle-like microcephaly-assoc'd, ASPM-SPD-2-Hydin/Immunoglobulin domain
MGHCKLDRLHVRKGSINRTIFLLVSMVIVMTLAQSGCVSSSGNLAANPTSLNFGNVAIGSSAKQSLVLTNSSTGAFTVTQTVASGGRFTVQGPPLPFTLSEGQSVTLRTSFSPKTIGGVSGSLTITSARTQSTSVRVNSSSVTVAPLVTIQQATITMTGSGVPESPLITNQPASETVSTGQTATFSVTVSGKAPFSYQWRKNGRAISGATSAAYTTPVVAASDSRSQFTVVTSNSAGDATSDVAILTVNAVSAGQLSTSSSSLNFNKVDVGSSSTLGVTFSNTGNSNLTVSNVSISGASYNATGMPTGLILAPGQTALLNITFAPATTGNLTGGLTVNSNASNSTASVILSGTGVENVAHSAILSWPESTGATVTGYDVYRATVSGRYTTPLNSAPISVATTQFVDSTVQAGQTYYYVFTFLDGSNGQSKYSNEVSATIPTP